MAAAKGQDQRTGKFQPGNKLAKGGRRPGSGRKPKEITNIEQQLVQDLGSIEKAWAKLEELVEAGNLDAIKYRIDRALGKPKQVIGGEAKGSFTLEIHPPKVMDLGG